MEYRQLQHSELTLSAIAFGAWAAGGWMWGQTDRHEAIKAMRAAYAEGMTSFDTAPIYGQGESEEIVGEALQDIPRDKVQILTKFGLRWDLNKGNFYVHSQNNQGKDIDFLFRMQNGMILSSLPRFTMLKGIWSDIIFTALSASSICSGV